MKGRNARSSRRSTMNVGADGKNVIELEDMDAEEEKDRQNRMIKRKNQSNMANNNYNSKPNEGSLVVPEVFNRLYHSKEHLSNCVCEACKSGPIDHNHPEKKPHSRKASNSSRGSSKGRPTQISLKPNKKSSEGNSRKGSD